MNMAPECCQYVNELFFMSRDVRTSQGTFMTRHDDPRGVISWIEEKAAQLTGLPVSHGEVRDTIT